MKTKKVTLCQIAPISPDDLRRMFMCRFGHIYVEIEAALCGINGFDKKKIFTKTGKIRLSWLKEKLSGS